MAPPAPPRAGLFCLLLAVICGSAAGQQQWQGSVQSGQQQQQQQQSNQQLKASNVASTVANEAIGASTSAKNRTRIDPKEGYLYLQQPLTQIDPDVRCTQFDKHFSCFLCCVFSILHLCVTHAPVAR